MQYTPTILCTIMNACMHGYNMVSYLTEVEPLCATMRLLQVVPNGTPIQSPSATLLPTNSGLLAQALPVE